MNSHTKNITTKSTTGFFVTILVILLIFSSAKRLEVELLASK